MSPGASAVATPPVPVPNAGMVFLDSARDEQTRAHAARIPSAHEGAIQVAGTKGYPIPTIGPVLLPEVRGPWTRATRNVLQSRYVQESVATFVALALTEGRVLLALMRGQSGAGAAVPIGQWICDFFTKSPEATLRQLGKLHLPASEKKAIASIVSARTSRMVGTGVGIASAVLAWNELAHTMDDRRAGRLEKAVRFAVFGASLLGCIPSLPQLRLLSSGVALAGAVLEGALWTRESSAVLCETPAARPTARPTARSATWTASGSDQPSHVEHHPSPPSLRTKEPRDRPLHPTD